MPRCPVAIADDDREYDMLMGLGGMCFLELDLFRKKQAIAAHGVYFVTSSLHPQSLLHVSTMISRISLTLLVMIPSQGNTGVAQALLSPGPHGDLHIM